MDAQALSNALAGNYLLVDLQLRSWSGKKTDRGASDELIASKQATGDSGAFVKNLLASAGQELKVVHRHGAALRSFVYASTLPWTSASDGARRGERLLSTGKSMNFLRDLNNLKREYDASVMQLVAAWPHRVAEAMHNLGSLANLGDYPQAADLPAMFSVTVNIKPVPAVGDFTRLNVPAELAQALGDRHMLMAEQQVQNAMADLRERLVGELERMNTQLGKHGAGEKTRLFDSLVTNLQGVVDLARNMNVTGNPKLAELADRIEAKLLQHPVEVYKNDVGKSAVVATEAQQLAVEAAMEELWQ